MSAPVPPDQPRPAPVRYRCRHTTRYSYTVQVVSSQLIAHLGPRDVAGQRARVVALTVEPEPAVVADRLDWLGNPTSYVAIDTPHLDLSMTVELDVILSPRPVPDLEATPAWEAIAAEAPRRLAVAEFIEASPRLPQPSPDLAAFAADSFPAGRPVGAGARDLARRIHDGFAFDAAATSVTTPVLEALALKRGVCQDFAHVMIGALRALGLPARYVSGYLRTLPPPGQPRLQGADASHAWVQIWCGPDAGWIDMDPTNDTLIDRNHITLAYGRDYDDVCPLRGVILGGDTHALYVSVDVEEMGDEPPAVRQAQIQDGQGQSQSQTL
ncbi:transglutaminase-like putative cysteine protease [Nitrospirillum amazonense]|uniref:Transglutaminase-like putative cysteine protease n=1 Tax=Nitrospirillum amazonense TaxID=28077 RepID=A0A560K978_9PROT|nr:transglutaminase family protein [Nitrospirillum amazonense]TWB79883.1 transglutaminase-like putative cysteine protease [Nitrospirillum amazonense]